MVVVVEGWALCEFEGHGWWAAVMMAAMGDGSMAES